MDLAAGALSVFVMMSLFAKDGAPKLLPECTYALTGVECVDRVYTEHAVFEIGADGVTVRFGTSYADLSEWLDLPLLQNPVIALVQGIDYRMG